MNGIVAFWYLHWQCILASWFVIHYSDHSSSSSSFFYAGKTQCINHFRINDSWYLVDLPGYGYGWQLCIFDFCGRFLFIEKMWRSNVTLWMIVIMKDLRFVRAVRACSFIACFNKRLLISPLCLFQTDGLIFVHCVTWELWGRASLLL